MYKKVHLSARLTLQSHPSLPHGWGWAQDLSPGLSELHILRFHLAVLSLRRPFPLGADWDGWLQRPGRLSEVFHVYNLASFKGLNGHL